MSRCFRFPPPGYEKKIRIHETDLLAKENLEDRDSVQENRKDRKHKKDREKKDGKDRKEKKERKSKHKDKKDKKKRDKEKNGTSDEKKSEVLQSKHDNEEKIEGSKFVHELSRRIRDDGKALQSQSFEKIEKTGPRKAELPERMVEMVASNLRDSYGRKEDDMVKREDHRKVNGQRNHNVYTRGFEDIKEKKEKTQEMSELRKDPPPPPILNGVVENVKPSNLSKTIGEFRGNLGKRKELEINGYLHDNGTRPNKLPRLVCASPTPHTVIGKASKSERIQTNVYSTPRDVRDGNVYSTPRDVRNGNVYPTPPEVRNGNVYPTPPEVRNGNVYPTPPDVRNGNVFSTPPDVRNVNVYSTPPDVRNGNVDIKERRINGFNEAQRSGLHKTSSLLAVQANNGEPFGKPEPNVYSASSSLRIPLHVQDSSAKSSHTDLKYVNHISLPRKEDKVSSTKSSSTLPPVKKKKEKASSSSTRGPHPDAKYLNSILSIPKMDELLDSDDQEWLFGSKSKKHKPDRVGVDRTGVVDRVWNIAIRIDPSDDLWALPYVIPL